MQKSQAGSQLIQHSSKLPVPTDSKEYLDSDVSYRRWELTINYKTKVYLTDEEREYFLAQIARGMTVVQVGNLTLTSRFDCLIPIRNRVKPVSQSELEAVVERERQRMKQSR